MTLQTSIEEKQTGFKKCTKCVAFRVANAPEKAVVWVYIVSGFRVCVNEIEEISEVSKRKL